MLGWEFPPFFAGGVGVACEALARALLRGGVGVTYVMPRDPGARKPEGLRLLWTGGGREGAALRLEGLPGALPCYAAAAGASGAAGGTGAGAAAGGALYGPDLREQVTEFAQRCAALARERELDFDVIHAHDWTTFRAGLALRRLTGRPLVAHVHITEFDKSGGAHADPEIYALEREGMHGADRLAAVSRRVQRVCVERYGVPAERIRVIYNAVDALPEPSEPLGLPGPLVLFLGRVTLQKGPDYFVEAARRVLDHEPRVTFVLAGAGDLRGRLIERAAALGLGRHLLFAGFVDRAQAAALYQRADVFVMPSVSEPFGIVALEAMERGVPVIASRQSGVSELVRHALKVDFWNVDELAAKIVAALRYPALSRELRRNGRTEARRLTWDSVAHSVCQLYREVLHA
jgi:glycosyltransferase involved in cell wall biosynthesis